MEAPGERLSVIENALEKLRRRSAVAPRGAAAAPGAKPIPPAGPAVRRTRETGKPPIAPIASNSPVQPRKHIAVNLLSLRAAGYLPSEQHARRFADHYRKIKRPLIEKALASASPEMRLVLVSSALPGDGKTFTTVNLALSMARERDLSVLLIDADLPRAHTSHIFGLRGEPGLMDALVDESLDVESLVVRTDIHGLDILPAGKPVDNATELLASARMSQIATRITSCNPRRLALLDSSPLLGSSEADALVRIPGQIVLVVRASVTPRHAVLEAMEHVDPNRLQGLILNQVAVTTGNAYYYYGYSGHSSSDSGTSGAD
jgi:protein-tyrosine kinase